MGHHIPQYNIMLTRNRVISSEFVSQMVLTQLKNGTVGIPAE